MPIYSKVPLRILRAVSKALAVVNVDFYAVV